MLFYYILVLFTLLWVVVACKSFGDVTGKRIAEKFRCSIFCNVYRKISAFFNVV